jgi:type I restriction enzyme M protein
MSKRHSNRFGDLESMFLRLEELVLANSGEDEFEEIFKLLIAKFFDEVAGSRRFARSPSDEATFQDIQCLLDDASAKWPGVLEDSRPKLRPEHLAVCVDALSRHRILDAGFEALDAFFEFLVSRTAKSAKGQYFTPRHVVEMCVRILRPTPSETVLDPACGSGGFLVQAANWVRKGHAALNDANAFGDYCTSKIWGFDIDGRAARLAKALMILNGDGSANIVRLNSLLRKPDVAVESAANGDESPLIIEDVVRSRSMMGEGFDVILTNPPFAGDVRERRLLSSYELSAGKTRIERDVLFVERCLELLRPGGRMAIVLPHNKFAVDTWGDMRAWVFERARVMAVVGLGRNTFLPHTSQKASVLFLKKNVPGSTASTDRTIFFAVSERAGKSSTGQVVYRGDGDGESSWSRVDHDLGEIVDAFHAAPSADA